MVDRIFQKLVDKFGFFAFLIVVMTIPVWLFLLGIDTLISHSKREKYRKEIMKNRSNNKI
jgi:hypothetical protein